MIRLLIGVLTLWAGGTQTYATNVGMIRDMPYDPVRDLTPITQTTRADRILAACPSTGVATPTDLVTAIRTPPARNFDISGDTGSPAGMRRRLGCL